MMNFTAVQTFTIGYRERTPILTSLLTALFGEQPEYCEVVTKLFPYRSIDYTQETYYLREKLSCSTKTTYDILAKRYPNSIYARTSPDFVGKPMELINIYRFLAMFDEERNIVFTATHDIEQDAYGIEAIGFSEYYKPEEYMDSTYDQARIITHAEHCWLDASR